MKTDQKTIVITTPYFLPYGGGLEKYAYEIAIRLLKEFGWRVVIITSGEQKTDIKEEMDGLIVYRLSYSFKFSNTPFSFSWSRKIRKILREENPCVINIHTPVPGIGDVTSSVSEKTPIIVTYHAGSMRKGKLLPDIFVWLYEHGLLKTLLNRADRIVCTSDFLRFNFLDHYLEKSTTITPGVDSEFFKPNGKKSLSPVILFVAGLNRSEKYKGLDTLLHAVQIVHKKIPSLTLEVVGDGDMKSEYEKLAEDLDIRNVVHFKGRLTGRILAEEYQRATAFILSSSNESFSMVVLEAMSSGLPVVATNVGGLLTLVDDGKTGFLVPPNNPEALAENIIETLTGNRSAKFGELGRDKAVKDFQWNSRARSYDTLCKTLASPTIVHISAHYPPFLGGLERVAEETANQLANDGYNVIVLTSNLHAKNLPAVEIKKNLTVRRLRSFEFAHTAFMPGLLWQLVRVRKPAIFHLHLAQAYVPEMVWLAAKIRNVPYVVHFHLDVERSGKLGFIFDLWKRWIQPTIIRGASAVITLSPDQVKLINERYGKPINQIYFISNGVGENFLKIGDEERTFEKPLRLLFVARFSVQKRPDRLIEAMSLIKSDATLTMVGEGEDRQKLELMVSNFKLTNIVFPGRLDGEKLLDAYRNADVFVLPSDREGMPLVLLEAMATGLPICGSDVLGIHELVDGVGILVKNPSPETFAKAIDNLASNPDELQALRRKSLQKAQQYSWEKLIQKLEMVYKEIEQ